MSTAAGAAAGGATAGPPVRFDPAGGLVVLCGGERWDGIPGSHRRLAEALADRCPVLYVDPPVSPLTRHLSAHRATVGAGLRVCHPRLAVLTPAALPGHSRPGIRRATPPLVARALRRTLRDLGDPTVEALVVASLDDLLDACPARRRVVYATDDFVAGAGLMGLGPRFLERGERRQAAAADLVVAVTEDLAGRWRSHGTEAVVVPNGCDLAAHAGVRDEPVPLPVPSPVAVVVGRLSERLDLDLLEAVADRGTSLLLVGPRSPGWAPERLDRLLALPNVAATGAVPYSEVPTLLAGAAVGLTPYVDSAFNRASFPLKTLEYLAAGRRAVVSDLPAHRWLAASCDADPVAAGSIRVVAGASAFAAAVASAAAEGDGPEQAAARQAVARGHSWASRADAVLDALDLVPGRAPAVDVDATPGGRS